MTFTVLSGLSPVASLFSCAVFAHRRRRFIWYGPVVVWTTGNAFNS